MREKEEEGRRVLERECGNIEKGMGCHSLVNSLRLIPSHYSHEPLSAYRRMSMVLSLFLYTVKLFWNHVPVISPPQSTAFTDPTLE